MGEMEEGGAGGVPIDEGSVTWQARLRQSQWCLLRKAGALLCQVNIIRKGRLQGTAPPRGSKSPGAVWKLLLCDCKVIRGLAGSRLGRAQAAQGGSDAVNDYLYA